MALITRKNRFVAFWILFLSSVLLGMVLLERYSGPLIGYLSKIRAARARGRTVYLGGVIPNTVYKAIFFSWIGAIYFLYSPFPWMVKQISDFIVMFQAFGNVIYTIGAIHGARILFQKSPIGTTGLVFGATAGSILYGLANANVGTVVRQRQMILWIIFLLGGIGFAHFVTWDTEEEI